MILVNLILWGGNKPEDSLPNPDQSQSQRVKMVSDKSLQHSSTGRLTARVFLPAQPNTSLISVNIFADIWLTTRGLVALVSEAVVKG